MGVDGFGSQVPEISGFGWLNFLADWDIFRVEKSIKVYILQSTFYQTAMC